MCIQSLPIAVLIVCSTNGFLELFRNWQVATAKSLYLTYGKPEVLCNSLVDMYPGKRSASMMTEFFNFCSLVMTVSETDYCGDYPIFERWCHTLFLNLQNCLWAWYQHCSANIFLLAAF